jgi:hypothetical protein
VAYWNTSVNTFSNDQYAEATVLDGAAGTIFAGAVVRHQPSTSSGYLAFFSGGHAYLYRIDSGSFTLIAGPSGTSGIIDGSVIRLEVIGITLTVKANGTTVITTNDATYASGSPGIASYSSGKLDNWTGGPIVAGSQTLSPNLVAGDDAFIAPALSLLSFMLPAMPADADNFFVPVVSALATVLPALVTDTDIFAVSAVLATATVLPLFVTDTDVVFAVSFGGVWILAPALVFDTDTIFAPATFQAQNLQPQLVSDNDNINTAVVTYLPILRPARVFKDVDLFYPASLVGGLPVVKHALTGSVRRPVLAGNLGSRRVLTGTLKRVG